MDAASGTLERLRPVTYVLYCLNFTTFLLGPIQRYPDFERQWSGREPAIEPSFEAHVDAVNRVLRGLVKKFVVAEFLTGYALQPGAEIAGLSTGEVLLGTYLFYFLLYFDFSGYCDVVIGVGALCGIRPPENFHLPFLSPNVVEFWLRVHRSLTTWLTDYVFNPVYARSLRTHALGARPLFALSACLMLTLLVSGLWHGTTANFVVFGIAHGLLLIGYRAYERGMTAWIGRRGLVRLRASRLWHVASVALTFLATGAAYLPFVLDIENLTLFARRLAPA